MVMGAVLKKSRAHNNAPAGAEEESNAHTLAAEGFQVGVKSLSFL